MLLQKEIIEKGKVYFFLSVLFCTFIFYHFCCVCSLMHLFNSEFQGQSRVHARLCYLMGIDQMIVCVNKMDDKTVNYDESRFNQICVETKQMLTKIGYKTKRIPFIPISGFCGDNLCTQSKNMVWYKGFKVKIKKHEITGDITGCIRNSYSKTKTSS